MEGLCPVHRLSSIPLAVRVLVVETAQTEFVPQRPNFNSGRDIQQPRLDGLARQLKVLSLQIVLI